MLSDCLLHRFKCGRSNPRTCLASVDTKGPRTHNPVRKQHWDVSSRLCM
ncbi:rCG40863 [Rattus norvegicus]|uniref:RCG40863 n=1 Tax=Rattus norvegicus TaxID=10116 RepID=A6KKV3_RAT|nr:rCG40863 [Rattus norvegicus]